MKKCPDCKVVLKGWEMFCPKCSKNLYGPQQFPKVKERKWRLF